MPNMVISRSTRAERNEKFGAYAMKRVGAGAHLRFLSLRNAHTIRPITPRDVTP